MKPNRVAASVILGLFTILGVAPALGMLVLWRSMPRSESLTAYYLVFSGPVALLAWGIVKQKQAHRFEDSLLSAWSVCNSVLLGLDTTAFLGLMLHGCFAGLSNPFPPAYSH